MEYNKVCAICGAPYFACKNCVKVNNMEEFNKISPEMLEKYSEESGIPKDKLFVGFRSVCDTFKHYMVFGIINDLQYKKITKEEAKEKLEELGYNEYNIREFKTSIHNIAKKLFENDEFRGYKRSKRTRETEGQTD